MRPMAEEATFLIQQQNPNLRKTLTPSTAVNFDGCQFAIEMTDVRSANQRSVS